MMEEYNNQFYEQVYQTS